MKRNNFGYLMREGVRALFKHGFMSFAAICITVACLVIINSFALISYNMDLMAKDAEENVRILVFIDEDYSEAESRSVGSELNLVKNVAKTEFITRAQALEDFIGDSDREPYKGLETESFRDQYEITLEDISLTEETAAELSTVKGVALVRANPEMANGLATVRNLLYLASVAITVVLLIVSLIIISNTIKLAMLDRREEISIMKIVGATNGFIRWPFFVEGFLLGLFGAAISFFLEWGLYEVARKAVLSIDLAVLKVVPFTDLLLPMAGICAVSGFLIGIFGTMMSIRRFLKV